MHFSIIFSRNFKWPHFEITCFNIKSRDKNRFFGKVSKILTSHFFIAHNDFNDIDDDMNRKICTDDIA